MEEAAKIKRKEQIGCVFIFLLVLACFFVSILTTSLTAERKGRTKGVEEEHQKAIDAGVGRWVIDQKTGERSFVYGAEEK